VSVRTLYAIQRAALVLKRMSISPASVQDLDDADRARCLRIEERTMDAVGFQD